MDKEIKDKEALKWLGESSLSYDIWNNKYRQDNESFEEAVLRELDEEVGVKSHIIAFVGEIEDYYNLIFRKNINRYFICKIDEITRIHHVSEGDSMIKDLLFVPLEEAISLYEKMSDYGVSKLVKQRELPILKEVKRMIDKKIMQIS